MADFDLVSDGMVVAKAHVNIALIKYWGKAPSSRPEDANTPAVPSLSLTLDGLWTETSARFAPDAESDVVNLDGERLTGEPLKRCVQVLDRVRELADVAAPFEIHSTNHVPTAAGLASSASGMAALAAAAVRCAGLGPGTGGTASRIARIGSGSASRSIYGGWVAWEGAEARPLFGPDHLDVALVVAVVDAGRKKIGSRTAMNRTRETSPYYKGWVEQSQETFVEGSEALGRGDLGGLIAAMEASTMRMHACAMGARPPILYWKAPSLAVIDAVERLRSEDDLTVGWTMDAGPNVKVLCRGDDAAAVAETLGRVDGVRRILVSRAGTGVVVDVR